MSTKSMINYQGVEATVGFQQIAGDDYVDHQPLSEVMPTRLGGVARHYITAKQVGQIVEAAKVAIESKIPYRVIGSGTATLVGESGFPGLVIKNQTSNIFSLDNTSLVTCDSGVDNSRLVNVLASKGLGGIEFLSVVPGTVGSALATNASALGKKIVSYIRQVTLFDPDSKKVITISQGEISSPEFLKVFRSDIVFPPIILTLSLQLAVLTQEEIIRRLGLIKRYLPKTTERVFSHLLSEKIDGYAFDKNLVQAMKQLKVGYDHKTGSLSVKKDTTPRGVKMAVDQIIQRARELGIEDGERLTYLGYFSDESVA